MLNDDGTKMTATVTAAPVKRIDVTGDVVLERDPTGAEAGALGAWLDPGSRYSHEFVYPDNQVRDIVQRTKTVVLSEETSQRAGDK